MSRPMRGAECMGTSGNQKRRLGGKSQNTEGEAERANGGIRMHDAIGAAALEIRHGRSNLRRRAGLRAVLEVAPS